MRFRPGTSTMLALLGGLVAVTAALPGCGSSSSPPPDYTLGTQNAGPGSGGGRDLFLQAYHLGKGRDPDHSVTLSRSEGALVVRVERGAAINGIEPDNIYQDPATPRPCKRLSPNAFSCRASALRTVFVSLKDTNGNNTVRVSPASDRLPVDVYAEFGEFRRAEGSKGRFVGGGEDDTCVGGPGGLVCSLGGGNDNAQGSVGNDRIIGGPGKDNCVADGGHNVVQGCETHQP